MVGYDAVGFSPVRFPDVYNRPYLNEDGRFSGIVYSLCGRFYMNVVGFLVMVWSKTVGYEYYRSIFSAIFGNKMQILLQFQLPILYQHQIPIHNQITKQPKQHYISLHHCISLHYYKLLHKFKHH